MLRLRAFPLIVALSLAAGGCESQTSQVVSFPSPTAGNRVAATMTASAGGMAVTVTQPGALPAAVTGASRLQVGVGGQLLDVTRTPDGTISFVVPAQTKLDKDANGDLRVYFVVDERTSVPVILATGGPTTFAQPPVTTDPASGAVALGQTVKLTANTNAPASQFQFAWSVGASAQGPFQSVPGEGKTIEWTPAAAGNYFVHVDAIDRTTHQTAGATSTQALVLVTSSKDVITTDPAAGFVALGSAVTLNFNAPTGFTGTGLHYAWSQGASPQGPWTPLNGDAPSIRWTPGAAGNYVVKVDVSDPANGRVSSFVSPSAEVFVGQSTGVITASSTSVERGDAVDLTVNAESATGPVSWYVAPAGGSALTTSFTRIVGATSKTIHYVATDAGSFNFRVDVPQPDGTVASFTTAQPVLNVVETTPVIQTDPPNEIVRPGSAVTLKLNARGLEEGAWRFVWSVSTNPSFGWTTLPLTNVSDLTKKTTLWRTATPSAASAGTTPGAYYVKVDASEVSGTRAYTIISSTPVVTVQP